MPTFDPWQPIPLQRDRWSCFPNALQWATNALGLSLPEGTVRGVFRDNRIVTGAGFLTDLTGHDFHDFTAEQWAEAGLAAFRVMDCTFDQVAAEAGLYPLILGSWRWYHYVAVRDYDPVHDRLILANGYPRWRQIGNFLTRQTFALGLPITLTRVGPVAMLGSISEQVEHNRRRGREGIERPGALLLGPRLVVPEPPAAPARRAVALLDRPQRPTLDPGSPPC